MLAEAIRAGFEAGWKMRKQKMTARPFQSFQSRLNYPTIESVLNDQNIGKLTALGYIKRGQIEGVVKGAVSALAGWGFTKLDSRFFKGILGLCRIWSRSSSRFFSGNFWQKRSRGER